jgi:hypothetical protein
VTSGTSKPVRQLNLLPAYYQLSVTETGAISTRYRTVTCETYPKLGNIGTMIAELALSSSVNSFELRFDQ